MGKMIVAAVTLAAVLGIALAGNRSVGISSDEPPAVAEKPGGYAAEQDDQAHGTVVPPAVEKTAPWQKEITPTPAQWTRDQSLGADNPQLDFAGQRVDDEGLIGTRVIFHGYFGLFVYDTTEQEIVYSLDLNAIGCAYTQGDAYCDVAVNALGDTVTLHPMNSDTMYVLQLEDNYARLYETPFDGNAVTKFRTVGIDHAFPEGHADGTRSDTAAMFSTPAQTADGSGVEEYLYYGYLYFSDETIGGIQYHEDDMIFDMFM